MPRVQSRIAIRTTRNGQNAKLRKRLRTFKSQKTMQRAFTMHLRQMGIQVESIRTQDAIHHKNWFLNVDDEPGILVIGEVKKRA